MATDTGQFHCAASGYGWFFFEIKTVSNNFYFNYCCSLKLLAQKKPCKKYDDILSKLYKYPPADLRKMNEANAPLYTLLTKHTGKVNKQEIIS